MKQEINELGIQLRHYHNGSYKTVCPQCSTTRKKKFDTCLSVTIEDDFVVFNCHHCNFSGKRYSLESQKRYQKVVDLPTQRKIDDTTVEWFQEEELANKQ